MEHVLVNCGAWIIYNPIGYGLNHFVIGVFVVDQASFGEVEGVGIILVDAATIFWNENAVYYYTLVANDFSNDLGCP